MSAQTQQPQITDDEWLRAHRDQLVKQNVPAAVHAMIARSRLSGGGKSIDGALLLLLPLSKLRRNRKSTATPNEGSAQMNA